MLRASTSAARSRASRPCRAALGDGRRSTRPSGFDALQLLPRTAYDLVITDINMPDISTLEPIGSSARAATSPSSPLLVISTQSSERDRARSLALGADDFLPKPFTPEALLPRPPPSASRPGTDPQGARQPRPKKPRRRAVEGKD